MPAVEPALSGAPGHGPIVPLIVLRRTRVFNVDGDVESRDVVGDGEVAAHVHK